MAVLVLRTQQQTDKWPLLKVEFESLRQEVIDSDFEVSGDSWLHAIKVT